MKKLLCLLMALSMIFTLFACGKTETDDSKNSVSNGSNQISTPSEGETDVSGESSVESETDIPADKPEAPAGDEGAAVPEEKPTEKPADKPASSASGTEKPADKPSTPPAAPPAASTAPSTPSAPPAESEKPSDPPAPEAPSAGETTVGDTLLAVWRANTSKSAEEIANSVLAHESIQFMSAVVPVSEGLLTGFNNTEIKGFSNGVMFGPTIGTIPFVGYVFELSAGTDADAFVSTLKSSANPRWNICTEAEQTIVDRSGNKVFFLMCPKSFEE